MNSLFQFGEDIPGISIKVLNEREIRAAAGILFVILFISVMLALLKADFLMLKFSMSFFLIDLIIRVFINPKFSPFLIAGRLFVYNQNPEYVGAPQKKFAWIIGIIFSATAFTLIVIMNTYSPISGIICFICLTFLLFESSFGICLGCIAYRFIYRKKIQYCPGEVCRKDPGTEKMKVTFSQFLTLLLFIVLLIFSVALLKDSLSSKPSYLFAASEIYMKND